MIKSDVEQAHSKQLFSKNLPIKVILYVIITVNTCEQKMT